MNLPTSPKQERDAAERTEFGIVPSFLWFSTITLSLLGTALALWLCQPVSNQELLATYARSQDFWEGARSVGGVPWWSPMFLQGASLAPSWSFLLSNLVLMMFSIPFGIFAGPKIALILLMFVGALGVWLFLWRYCKNPAVALVGGSLFLLNPSLLVRTFEFEHFVVVASMAVLPWVFLALHSFLQTPSTFTALWAAVAYAALALTFGKTALMALPAIGIFFVVEWLRRDRSHRPAWKLITTAAAAVFLLALIPALPALRESGLVAMFEFGPFEGWQHAFSTKSPVGWLDRSFWLTTGVDPAVAPTSANGGTYTGILGFLFLAIALLRNDLHDTETARKGRLFLSIYLVMYWLSFGPSGVVGGQMALLRYSAAAPDYLPAVAWLLFFVQGWIMFRLVPRSFPGRSFVALLLCGLFFFLPGFRLLEWLPLFKNIRAPFDFLHVTGAVCLILAASLLSRSLIKFVPQGPLRSGIVAAMVAVGLLDILPYARGAFSARMDREVFEDFLSAQSHLAGSTIPGRVFALSGRYFYLLTPRFSGRPLANEAFMNYLQQRGIAALQAAAFLSDDFLVAYFQAAGISHVLIDKTDPDTQEELQKRMRQLLPVSLENENFVILENKETLGFGFIARDFIHTGTSSIEIAPAVLGGVNHRLATIESIGRSIDDPHMIGTIREGRIAANEGAPLREGPPFQLVPRRPDFTYQRVSFEPAPEAGWMIFNEAWHPDWRAFVNSDPREIHRAMLGFSAVRVSAGETVTFQFSAPWWYDVCAWIGIVSWVGALGVLTAGLFVPRHGKEECL